MAIIPNPGTTVLDGTAVTHALSDTVTFFASGLRGVAELTDRVLLGTDAANIFRHSLANSGMARTTNILLTHETAPDAPDKDVEITAQVDAGSNAVLLVHDATGALSWHWPKTPSSAAVRFTDAAAGRTPAVSSAQPTETISFTVPAGRFAVVSAPVGLLGRADDFLKHFSFHLDVPGLDKVLSVIEYPVEHLVGMKAEEWLTRWEDNKHPSVARWFPPTAGVKAGEPLSPTNWHELAKGPVLLFIHGFFSSCESAFSGLGAADSEFWSSLRDAYGNRIIAFDHPTATVSPADNAKWLLEQLPNVQLDVDVVCHSRGGLVARSLAQAAEPQPNGGRMNIRKVIFAATPNAGTSIANIDTWGSLIDRISTMLTLPAVALPAPVDVASEILAGLLEIVKIIGTGAKPGLPGLTAMVPGSDYLNELSQLEGLSQPAGQARAYYAAAANFVPGPLLAHLFRQLDYDARFVDAGIFDGVPNDIVVPTDSVWDLANPEVPQERRFPITPGDTYWYCSSLGDQALRAKLLSWLTATP